MTQSENKEVHSLITFKGGIVCSVGNGKVCVVSVQASKEAERPQISDCRNNMVTITGQHVSWILDVGGKHLPETKLFLWH